MAAKKEKIVKFTTKRLKLESMTDAEIEIMIENTSDPEMKKAYGEMLEGCRKDPANRLWYTPWKMLLKKEKTFIGDLAFKGPANEYGMVEIGYGIKAEFEGQGYMTEAVKGMIDYAFGFEEVFFIEAETDPDNKASQRVLEKNQFIQEGEGEEGPRFYLKKPENNMLAVGVALGMCFGSALGSAFQNMALGIGTGMCIGIAIGSIMSREAKKKQAIAADLRIKCMEEKKAEKKAERDASCN